MIKRKRSTWVGEDRETETILLVLKMTRVVLFAPSNPTKQCFLCMQKTTLPQSLRSIYADLIVRIFVDVGENRSALDEVKVSLHCSLVCVYIYIYMFCNLCICANKGIYFIVVADLFVHFH